jgi:hypothetical protein
MIFLELHVWKRLCSTGGHGKLKTLAFGHLQLPFTLEMLQMVYHEYYIILSLLEKYVQLTWTFEPEVDTEGWWLIEQLNLWDGVGNEASYPGKMIQIGVDPCNLIK